MEGIVGVIPSYFHTVPYELLEIILSYLTNREDVTTLQFSYYLFKKLTKSVDMWKRLIHNTRYGEVFKDEIKAEGFNPTPDNYINFYYTLNSEMVFPLRSEESKKVSNIYGRYDLWMRFPGFYDTIKIFHINDWYEMNDVLKDPDNFLQWPYYFDENFVNFIKTGDLPVGYKIYQEIYHSDHDKYVSYIILSLFFHPKFDINVQIEEIILDLLELAFNIDEQIYEMMLNKISVKKLKEIISKEKTLIQDKIDNTVAWIKDKFFEEIKTLEFINDLIERSKLDW
jgi:hypothetical protein